ncbi:hypothetical protein CJF30_00002937 [Rutstroemia sp. NJR-2017a BBW]|nr:hypothetical protein CJF30_00002937 [Rutstroemia sp. NJR-2017a BBW]
MSTAPTRTRSIRKPAEGSNLIRLDKPAATAEISTSPSRLPTIKPRSKTISNGSATSGRPLSTTSIATNNTSMRPPPTRTNISKPPSSSSGLTRSASVKNAASSSTEPVKDRSRPPITLNNRFNRTTPPVLSTSGSTRAPSHQRTTSTSTTLLTQSSTRPQPHDAPSRSRPQSLYADPPSRHKPAFSTLQQHFSPAKNLGPKPHPAAFLAAPTPSKLPSNIAISAETSKLQNELLQLHLLHRDAGSVNLQWKASARKKLGAKFQVVVKRREELVLREVEAAGRINAGALKEWEEAGTPGWGLEERVQVLDEVLNGAWNLGESGGKYGRLVRKFEKWVIRCEEILRDREEDRMLDEEEEIVFIEELPAGWKDECLVLGRKLEGWRDALRDLGTVEQESTLKSVVDGAGALVNGMIMELEMMARIEADAVGLEQEWIKSVNGSLEDDDTPAAGAVWRFM